MDRIKELKDQNKSLARDISRNQKAILTSVGVILMIAISCLGGGVFVGLIVDKMAKAIMTGIGAAALLSTKSIAEISSYNRDIHDCESQIAANNREIVHTEKLLAKEKERIATQTKTKTETKGKSYSFKSNQYAKKNEEFNDYLNNLKEEGFFDYNEPSHKKR